MFGSDIPEGWRPIQTGKQNGIGLYRATIFNQLEKCADALDGKLPESEIAELAKETRDLVVKINNFSLIKKD